MAGQTLHPHEMAAVDNSGDHPRVPLGYLQKDDGRFLARTAYTDPMDVATTTWMTDNVLKLSGLEIKMRGRKAKLYKDQVLHPTLAAVAKKDQTQREEWANQMQKELGARGEPMFQSLSYVKCVSCCHDCLPASVPVCCTGSTECLSVSVQPVSLLPVRDCAHLLAGNPQGLLAHVAAAGVFWRTCSPDLHPATHLKKGS